MKPQDLGHLPAEMAQVSLSTLLHSHPAQEKPPLEQADQQLGDAEDHERSDSEETKLSQLEAVNRQAYSIQHSAEQEIQQAARNAEAGRRQREQYVREMARQLEGTMVDTDEDSWVAEMAVFIDDPASTVWLKDMARCLFPQIENPPEPFESGSLAGVVKELENEASEHTGGASRDWMSWFGFPRPYAVLQSIGHGKGEACEGPGDRTQQETGTRTNGQDVLDDNGGRLYFS